MSIFSAREWERHFVFGRFSRDEVLKRVTNRDWQRTRKSMIATSLAMKWDILEDYLLSEKGSYEAQVRVTNYVYALKRGGLIRGR